MEKLLELEGMMKAIMLLAFPPANSWVPDTACAVPRLSKSTAGAPPAEGDLEGVPDREGD